MRPTAVSRLNALEPAGASIRDAAGRRPCSACFARHSQAQQSGDLRIAGLWVLFGLANGPKLGRSMGANKTKNQQKSHPPYSILIVVTRYTTICCCYQC